MTVGQDSVPAPPPGASFPAAGPGTFVAGFGHRTGATAASLRAALRLVEAAGGCVATVFAAPADKCAPIVPLAAARGVAPVPVAAAALSAVETFTRSPASLAARGTGSVAEAAALAAAGPGARLIVPRRISPDRMATCAIAQGAEP